MKSMFISHLLRDFQQVLRVKMTFVMQHHIAIIIISSRLSSILHDKNTQILALF
jgi:hypothetical protein